MTAFEAAPLIKPPALGGYLTHQRPQQPRLGCSKTAIFDASSDTFRPVFPLLRSFFTFLTRQTLKPPGKSISEMYIALVGDFGGERATRRELGSVAASSARESLPVG